MGSWFNTEGAGRKPPKSEEPASPTGDAPGQPRSRKAEYNEEYLHISRANKSIRKLIHQAKPKTLDAIGSMMPALAGELNRMAENIHAMGPGYKPHGALTRLVKRQLEQQAQQAQHVPGQGQRWLDTEELRQKLLDMARQRHMRGGQPDGHATAGDKSESDDDHRGSSSGDVPAAPPSAAGGSRQEPVSSALALAIETHTQMLRKPTFTLGSSTRAPPSTSTTAPLNPGMARGPDAKSPVQPRANPGRKIPSEAASHALPAAADAAGPFYVVGAAASSFLPSAGVVNLNTSQPRHPITDEPQPSWAPAPGRRPSLDALVSPQGSSSRPLASSSSQQAAPGVHRADPAIPTTACSEVPEAMSTFPRVSLPQLQEMCGAAPGSTRTTGSDAPVAGVSASRPFTDFRKGTTGRGGVSPSPSYTPQSTPGRGGVSPSPHFNPRSSSRGAGASPLPDFNPQSTSGRGAVSPEVLEMLVGMVGGTARALLSAQGHTDRRGSSHDSGQQSSAGPWQAMTSQAPSSSQGGRSSHDAGDLLLQAVMDWRPASSPRQPSHDSTRLAWMPPPPPDHPFSVARAADAPRFPPPGSGSGHAVQALQAPVRPPRTSNTSLQHPAHEMGYKLPASHPRHTVQPTTKAPVRVANVAMVTPANISQQPACNSNVTARGAAAATWQGHPPAAGRPPHDTHGAPSRSYSVGSAMPAPPPLVGARQYSLEQPVSSAAPQHSTPQLRWPAPSNDQTQPDSTRLTKPSSMRGHQPSAGAGWREDPAEPAWEACAALRSLLGAARRANELRNEEAAAAPPPFEDWPPLPASPRPTPGDKLAAAEWDPLPTTPGLPQDDTDARRLLHPIVSAPPGWPSRRPAPADLTPEPQPVSWGRPTVHHVLQSHASAPAGWTSTMPAAGAPATAPALAQAAGRADANDNQSRPKHLWSRAVSRQEAGGAGNRTAIMGQAGLSPGQIPLTKRSVRELEGGPQRSLPQEQLRQQQQRSSHLGGRELRHTDSAGRHSPSPKLTGMDSPTTALGVTPSIFSTTAAGVTGSFTVPNEVEDRWMMAGSWVTGSQHARHAADVHGPPVDGPVEAPTQPAQTGSAPLHTVPMAGGLCLGRDSLTGTSGGSDYRDEAASISDLDSFADALQFDERELDLADFAQVPDMLMSEAPSDAPPHAPDNSWHFLPKAPSLVDELDIPVAVPSQAAIQAPPGQLMNVQLQRLDAATAAAGQLTWGRVGRLHDGAVSPCSEPCPHQQAPQQLSMSLDLFGDASAAPMPPWQRRNSSAGTDSPASDSAREDPHLASLDSNERPAADVSPRQAASHLPTNVVATHGAVPGIVLRQPGGRSPARGIDTDACGHGDQPAAQTLVYAAESEPAVHNRARYGPQFSAYAAASELAVRNSASYATQASAYGAATELAHNSASSYGHDMAMMTENDTAARSVGAWMGLMPPAEPAEPVARAARAGDAPRWRAPQLHHQHPGASAEPAGRAAPAGDASHWGAPPLHPQHPSRASAEPAAPAERAALAGDASHWGAPPLHHQQPGASGAAWRSGMQAPDPRPLSMSPRHPEGQTRVLGPVWQQPVVPDGSGLAHARGLSVPQMLDQLAVADEDDAVLWLALEEPLNFSDDEGGVGP